MSADIQRLVMPHTDIDHVGGIADQDDLLLRMVAQDPWAGSGSGVMRWRRDVDKWHPVLYVPVKGDDRSSEPGLVRDVDGALLFCARGKGGPKPDRPAHFKI